MRIDSSGNVKIISGNLQFGASGSETGQIEISSSNLLIRTTGDKSGLRFDTNAYTPFKNGSAADGTVDLGFTSGKFRDLYLSNSVKIGAATNGTALLDLGDTDNFNVGRIAYDNSDNSMRFTTNSSEAMRIDSSGILLVGTTDTNPGNNTSGSGVVLNGSDGKYSSAVNQSEVMVLNRMGNDGDVLLIRQAGSTEGTISVSGSTVTYGGFSGQHESSGIATDTPVGTVVSTIDELDTYPTGTTKAGQTRADHAKVKVSNTVGDSAVYGIVSRFDEHDKVFVTSVGIGSVRVTGACARGDLLESNGDGTAKVQSDDIVRSKTLGKVTIGNSNTGVKLVSCVLYCG